MSGACGPCTLCCTVMKVAMEPPKPARTPCAHCTKAGCSIYQNRPDPCRDFSCGWLLSQSLAVEPMQLALRPDRCGVVIELNSAGTFIAHCKQPAAWKRQPMRAFLTVLAMQGKCVMIEPGDGTYLLDGNGNTRLLEFVGIDPKSNERLYRVPDDQ